MQLAERNCPLGKSKVYGVAKGKKLNEIINTHTVSRDGLNLFIPGAGHATVVIHPLLCAILDLSFNHSVFLTFFEGLLSFNAKNIMARLRIKLTE